MRLSLLPISKGTSDTHDGGIEEWLWDNHLLRDGNLKTVEFDKNGLADAGSRKVREIMKDTRKTLEGHLGNQGVSAGGMLAPYRHNVNFDVFVNC